MVQMSRLHRWSPLVLLLAVFTLVNARSAQAQGFISPSVGYNFGGDSGCPTATDCEEKNWNWGVSLGALGSVVGFEAELTYEDNFSGERTNEKSDVTTVMGNFMIAPKFSFVQPYGLAGIGLIKTGVDNLVSGTSEDENQIGWTIGGGLIVYVQRHIGLKADIRHYHAFEALQLLGFDLARDRNKLDFGRVGFGAVFKF